MTSRYLLAAVACLIGGIAVCDDELASTTREMLEARLFDEARGRLEAVSENAPDFAIAQRLLGEIYADGRGIDVDPQTAVKYFRTAARLGDVEAMYRLALAYENGAGIEASAASAYTWYDAAALENPRAACRYAEIALANAGKEGFVARHDPLERLRFAADKGVPRAQFLVGRLALDGEYADIGEEQALRLLTISSDSEAEANTILGLRAHNAGDIAEARNRFDVALSKGDVNAAAYLGHYAEHGLGEPIDRKKAWDYYRQAETVPWAKEGLRRLKGHSQSIELLGMRVYGASRKEVWRHFRAAGLALLANEDHWDAFDASTKLGGKKGVVTVAYAPEPPHYVAEVSYRIEGQDRRDARAIYREVNESLVGKYGEVKERDRKNSTRYLSWGRENTVIQLSHDSGNTAVEVTYKLMPYSASLRAYLAKNNPKGDIRDAL